jgi:hypothetical protein
VHIIANVGGRGYPLVRYLNGVIGIFFGTNDRRWGLVVNASMENRFESFDGSFPAAVSAAGAGGLAA